jgi:hypothetical protein
VNIDDLYNALAGIPRLPGALCRGEAELFDDFDLPDEALQLCAQCPALTDCARWFDSLRPSQRPHGVIAGTVNRPPRPRKRAS